MRKMNKNRRYIYDPLYGAIYLPDFIWGIIPCPELQRLREVRLCNINSFCLTGGANINRYEHSIGTCYLAQECLNFWPPLNPIDEKEQELFLLAALLHDVSSAAFGHSFQYIESRYGFEHEAFKYAVTGEKGNSYSYKSTTLEPIFFGMGRELPSKISTKDLNEIDKIIKGEGRFGPLINSTMDLDNIDNVFRLAYHIGLVKSGEIPLKLARSLYIENNKLIVRKEAVPLVEEWHKLRKRLYLLLLLNPEEFSAKCMLTEAIELAKEKEIHPFNWYDVDFELLQKSSKASSETSNIISRLMKGQLYGCIGVFSTSKIDKYELFIDMNERRELENKLGENIKTKYLTTIDSSFKDIIDRKEIPSVLREALRTIGYDLSNKTIIRSSGENKWKIEDGSHRYLMKQVNKGIEVYKLIPKYKNIKVAIHPIQDVDKTERQVCIQTDDGRVIKIGKSSRQLIIGVFFKNAALNMYKIRDIPNDTMHKIRQEVYIYLSNILEDPNLREVQLYDEINECK